MGKIFICYRRQDSQDMAGRLFDRLVDRFGEANVFFDVDKIPLAVKFPERIREAIAASDVVLVLIGGQWIDICDDKGNRRLEDPRDYVRQEIEEALRQGVPAVPVLLDNAPMPTRDKLPQGCGEIVEVNAPRVRAGSDFKRDAPALLDALADLMDARGPRRVNENVEQARRQGEKKTPWPAASRSRASPRERREDPRTARGPNFERPPQGSARSDARGAFWHRDLLGYELQEL